MSPSQPGLVLAVDLGGTKIETALIDGSGSIVPGTRYRAATGPATDAGELDCALEHVISRTCAGSPMRPVAAGIGTAGPIDVGGGTTSPINLPRLQDYPLAARVAELSGASHVTMRLDGSCIALAELWTGAAQNARHALVFVVSTGIGGGVVSGGRILDGGSGNAGHLGQLVIAEPEDDSHESLLAATVEGRASGPRTVAWARGQGWEGSSGEELGAAAAAGDDIARRALVRSADAVGTAVANVAMLLDIDLAVIGGGFSLVATDYVDLVQAAAHARCANPYGRRVPVVRAMSGSDAPLIGAAALHWRGDLIR